MVDFCVMHVLVFELILMFYDSRTTTCFQDRLSSELICFGWGTVKLHCLTQFSSTFAAETSALTDSLHCSWTDNPTPQYSD